MSLFGIILKLYREHQVVEKQLTNVTRPQVMTNKILSCMSLMSAMVLYLL